MGSNLRSLAFASYAGQPAAGDKASACALIMQTGRTLLLLDMLDVLHRHVRKQYAQNLHSWRRIWWPLHSCQAGKSDVASIQTTTGAHAMAGPPQTIISITV